MPDDWNFIKKLKGYLEGSKGFRQVLTSRTLHRLGIGYVKRSDPRNGTSGVKMRINMEKIFLS